MTQDIYGASQLLHLQNVPQIVTALSGKEGLSILGKEHFDLVLVSGNLPDMDTPDFGRKVKAAHPDLPVVMVVFDGSWFDQTYRGAEPEGIDRTFAWRGSANVLLSIMKLVEDSQNIDRDLGIASIGTILVIEDAVEHYSLILPHLYSMLMQRTFMLVPEGINESDRQVRTRVRPKVLLARTFGEASALFEKYETSLVGIISDLHTFHDDRIDPEAGVRFLREVAARAPGIPILVQSSEPNAAEVAAVGGRALPEQARVEHARRHRAVRSRGHRFRRFRIPHAGRDEGQARRQHVGDGAGASRRARRIVGVPRRAQRPFPLVPGARRNHAGRGAQADYPGGLSRRSMRSRST